MCQYLPESKVADRRSCGEDELLEMELSEGDSHDKDKVLNIEKTHRHH